MFQNLDVFQMSVGLARHAGQRQAVVAQNVANADTPGYRAKDLKPFAQSFAPANSADVSPGLRASREKHIHGGFAHQNAAVPDRGAQTAPDGNSVSLEREMMKSIDAKRDHDRALAIYKSALGVLRSTLSK